jgi:hypothetical protein
MTPPLKDSLSQCQVEIYVPVTETIARSPSSLPAELSWYVSFFFHLHFSSFFSFLSFKGNPVYVSESLCAYTFTWSSSVACGGPPVPSYLYFTDLVGHFSSGSAGRVVLDTDLCTGSFDHNIGFSLDEFAYVERGAIGNAYSYLSFSESSLVSHASRGFLWSVTTLNVLEYQMAEVIRHFLDPVTFRSVLNQNVTCKYGEVTDGAVFYLESE